MYKGMFSRLVDENTQNRKEQLFLLGKKNYIVQQSEFNKIPGIPIVYWATKTIINAFQEKKLSELGQIAQGLITGDTSRFTRLWFEVERTKFQFDAVNSEKVIENGIKWVPYNKGGTYRKWFGNNDYVVNWENDGYEIKSFTDENGKLRSRPQGSDFYFKDVITWTKISSSKISFRHKEAGHISSEAGMTIYVSADIRKYILGFCNSKVADSILQMLSPTLNYELGDIGKLPIIIETNQKDTIDNIVTNNENISKQDWNKFELSWAFTRHPLVSIISQNRAFFDDTSGIDLEKCYSCWEDECNERFNQLKANEEELNRIFIDIYGLQDELTPEVEDKDVTVRKADLQRDIKSLISYAVGCMFGRYSIYEDGLIYAGGEWDYNKYENAAWRANGKPETLEFYQNTYFMPDEDNIIPITDEEYFSDDIVSRFCEWVKIVYGEKSLETNLNFIAKALGNKGNTSREVIRNYFLNNFFKDHCNTYSVTGSGKRPIYWLFDSGKQNGFKALIYMHRYDADTVGRVRTDYLHKAQKYVENAMQSAQYTIDNATSASEKSKATKAVTKYTKQLAEMKIYDEAIAHVANQRIEIDLDDGVKVNYVKFQGVEVAQEGKKALKVDLLAKI